MKTLKLTEFGNPILRLKAKQIPLKTLRTREFKSLIKDMIHTMRKTGGVGLAAPQIGKSIRLAVMEIRETPDRPKLKSRGPIAIINPKIKKNLNSKVSDWEGCLSFPGVRGKVQRPKSIMVEYYNEEVEKMAEKATGLWARIFQHEIDHLNGIGCIDKMNTKTMMTTTEFRVRILKKKI